MPMYRKKLHIRTVFTFFCCLVLFSADSYVQGAQLQELRERYEYIKTEAQRLTQQGVDISELIDLNSRIRRARADEDFSKAEELIEKAERALTSLKRMQETGVKTKQESGHLSGSSQQDSYSESIQINNIFKDVFGVVSLPDNPLKMSLSKEALGYEKFLETRAKVYRIVVEWQMIEPEPPVKGIHYYRWDLDRFIRKNQTNVVILRSRSKWGVNYYNPTYKTWSVPKDYNMWNDFLKAVVTRYKDRVKIWLVGGENATSSHWTTNGNIHEPSTSRANSYVEWLKHSYRSIKSIDPQAIVVGCSTFGAFKDDIPAQEEFINICLENCKNYFDAIDVRAYQEYETIPRRMQWFKNKMQSLGYLKPIITTEGGGPDFKTVFSQEEIRIVRNMARNGRWNEAHKRYWDKINNIFPDLDKTKSEDIIKRHMMVLSSGSKMYIWFRLNDEPIEEKERFINFMKKKSNIPWFLKTGLFSKNFAYGNPSLYTYQIMLGKLDDFERIESLDVKPNVYAFKFTFKDKSPVYVMWSDKGKAKIEFSKFISTDKAIITHIVTRLDKNKKPIFPLNEIKQKDDILVSETPIFVEEN